MIKEALLYPQTHLRLDLASLLLSFLEQIVLLQPSEAPPEGAFKELVEKGLVRLITPPPFGEKLSWFQKLVKSYEEWGQMMRWPENVSLFKAWPEAVEESVSEIKAALVGRDGRQDDPLLRARVVLQLAQDLDRHLEELDFEYERLKDQAQRLSDFVIGQDPTLRRFPHWIVEGREPNWEISGIPERMKAWAKIVSTLPSLPSALAVDQIEVRDTLLDLSERGEKLNIIPLEVADPLSEERKVVREKNHSRLEEKGLSEKPPSGPYLEIWRLPFETKSLLEAVLDRNLLQEGETHLLFFSRF